MAYISQYNFSRLIADPETVFGNFGLKIEDIQHKDVYEDKVIDWFTNLEKARLYLCKILLTDSDHPLNKEIKTHKWLKIKTEDFYKTALEPKKPRFHENNHCEWLQKDYINYNLPVDFLGKYGKEGVRKFRDWFKTKVNEENYYQSPKEWLENGMQSKFLAQVELKWGRVDWTRFSKEIYTNSGPIALDNHNLSKLKKKIDELLRKFDSWYKSLTTNEKNIIDSIKNNYCESKGLAEEFKDLAGEFKEKFKYPMQDLLLIYYYETAMNSNLSIKDSSILEELGFLPCKVCAASKQISNTPTIENADNSEVDIISSEKSNLNIEDIATDIYGWSKGGDISAADWIEMNSYDR
ncbi:hypothetical protein [Neisseria zalophi]|uniref:Uncharacterized protein n=1 Tax=Neisseria zalophi TaxID=640030 RepID=A0A5J6PWC0_9NEIS|nr:hypothetical protein [Neisseria zalophi]QEY26554.1 hypothetical protein D0T92_08430 [Neisseria zalophi]